MKQVSNLAVANSLALLVVLLVALAGWLDAAGVGLAVLGLLNLFVWLRKRSARFSKDK